MRFVRGFGMVTRREQQRANLFYESLTGVRAARRTPALRPFETYEQDAPSQPPAPPQRYLPAGGRNFVPQAGVFNCAPAGFVVIGASFLPERTTDAGAAAAIDTALTAAGLNATQRGRVTRAGLVPIATEFGGPALTELFARLRWSADNIAEWGHGADSMLVQRLLIHIPGHFRELARRAPDAREAFVLECLGWLLMVRVRDAVAGATRQTWWLPPRPAFVTVVPNPIPPVSAEVQRLLTRYLLIDTLMTADQWNAQLVAWGTGLAGRQWQAEVGAPQPGRPFYAGIATVPAHLSTAAPRAAFATAWTQRLADADARNRPDPPGATAVTLAGLRNAAELIADCDNDNRHLPAGAIGSLSLQGLELAYDFPLTRGTTRTRANLMVQLHPIYTALFQAIRELGWNDLLYQTSGAACFRGVRHDANARVTIGGVSVLVRPFTAPTATTVTQVNTNLDAAQRTTVLNAAQAARQPSNHGVGAAIDFNVPENGQRVAARPFGSMDPRIVAIFEAFHFRSGACFRPTDPMHFEYCETPCAPVAASAGTLGQVVTPRMLMPMRATERVLA